MASAVLACVVGEAGAWAWTAASGMTVAEASRRTRKAGEYGRMTDGFLRDAGLG